MTLDLIQALRDIEAEARRAQKLLAAGGAVNGRTALQNIEHEASDALVRAENETGGSGGHSEGGSFPRNGGEAPGHKCSEPSRSGSAAVAVDGRRSQSSRNVNGAALQEQPAPRPTRRTPS